MIFVEFFKLELVLCLDDDRCTGATTAIGVDTGSGIGACRSISCVVEIGSDDDCPSESLSWVAAERFLCLPSLCRLTSRKTRIMNRMTSANSRHMREIRNFRDPPEIGLGETGESVAELGRFGDIVSVIGLSLNRVVVIKPV